MSRDQPVQHSDPLDALGHTPSRQHCTVFVDDLDVVVVLSPVITHKQHPDSPRLVRLFSSAEETAGDLMAKCSPHKWGTTSQKRLRLLTPSGRTVCRKTSNGQMSGVLPRQPLPEPSLPKPPGKCH